MENHDKKEFEACHGQYQQILSCSDTKKIGPVLKFKNRIQAGFTNLVWHLKAKGLPGTIVYIFQKQFKINKNRDSHIDKILRNEMYEYEKTLNLQPGEIVQVKSEEEILAMLDQEHKFKGLRWMAGMNKHCGKQYRVFKRLETILLEGTGEYRKVRNTVLLEGVMCDGSPFNNCDRSCFFYWREAWLKRVNKDKSGL